MQFFIDSQGTVKNLISSPVYQGSTNANELVLVAPFSSANMVDAVFRLPNGIKTNPYLMKVQGTPMVIEGVTYNLWRCLLDGAITEYAGPVTVWFEIHQNGFYTNNGTVYNPITPTTYASTFTVQKGGTPNLENMTPSPNIYSAILDYLAQIYPQYNIMSVTYSAEGAEINTDEAVQSPLTLIPDSINPETDMKPGVNFSIANIDGSTGNPFYALNVYVNGDTGFTITFAEPQNIGKMQLNISGAYYLTELKVMAVLEDDSEVEIDSFQFLAPSLTNILVSVNKTVKSLSIIQPYNENVAIDNNNSAITDKGFTNGRFYIQAIKLWQKSLNGQITITSSTGRTIIFPDASYDTYVSLAQQAQESAQASATQASNALAQINAKAGQAGGYPILEEIGGSPKIPSVYINLVNTTEFVTITSESNLDTLQANVGTVARLVIDIDEEIGTKTVTKSFVKLQEGEGADKWALYATSYADNATNALYAQQSTNALKVNGLVINGVFSEADYNALPDEEKQNGVYFVSIEGE